MNNEQIDEIAKKYVGLSGVENYRAFAQDILAAPTVSDAGTIDTLEFRGLLKDRYFGVLSHEDFVAHIDKHVAAAVAELVRERDAARRSADAWHRTASAAEADLAKLRSTAGVGVPTWKERFAQQFPRADIEYCPSDMMACLMAEEIADLRAATAPVSAETSSSPEFLKWWEANADRLFDMEVEDIARISWKASRAPGRAAPTAWRDALRRSGADTDYHGLIAFTPVQWGRFVSMIVPPSAGAPVSGAGQADEDAFVIHRMGELLARVAVAVNGVEPPLRRWSYHDLPELVEKLVLELELHRAKETAAAPADGQELPALPPSDNAGDYVHDVQVYTVDETTQYGRACFNAGFLLAMRQPRGERGRLILPEGFGLFKTTEGSFEARPLGSGGSTPAPNATLTGCMASGWVVAAKQAGKEGA